MNCSSLRGVLTSLLLLPLCLYAQSGYVKGTVSEAVTGVGLPGVKVTLLAADSVAVLDTARTARRWRNYTLNTMAAAPFTLNCPRPGRYVLRFDRDGYEPLLAAVDADFSGRNRYYDAGDFGLMREARQLGEATVTATKIKMVWRGDTLVYNADAFQTAEGSMLEDLVKQLPGVELRGNRIYAAGKYVDNLLVNGRDFFRGNPEEALKNLPAYVVDKVKLYDRRGELSRTAGMDMNDDTYVMDVRLKREYNGYWMGQARGGMGTRDRYDAFLNLMRIDDRQAFILNAQANNLGKDEEVGNGGISSSTYYNNGLRSNKHVVGRYNYEPDDNLRVNASADFQVTDNDLVEGRSTETYLSSGNTYGRTEAASGNRDTRAAGSAGVGWRPVKGTFVQVDYNVSHTSNKADALTRSATFDARPEDYWADAILDSAFLVSPADALRLAVVRNRLSELSRERGRKTDHSVKLNAHRTFAPDVLNLRATFSHGSRANERFDHYSLAYPATGAATDYRNRYRDEEGRNYKYDLGADYFFKYTYNDSVNGQLKPYYTFTQTYTSAQNPLYRLDALEGWGELDDRVLGALPSTTDSLQRAIDAANSYFSDELQAEHAVGLSWTHEFRLRNRSWLQLSAEAPLRVLTGRLDYSRSARPYHVSRTDVFFEPSLSVRWRPWADDRSGEKVTWDARYNVKGTQPQLTHLLDIRDDSNPLLVALGNADLRATYTHRAELGFRRQFGSWSSYYNTRLAYSRTRNAVGISTVYDRATGVSTTRPVNVDGNWEAEWAHDFMWPLNKKQTGLIYGNLQGGYRHSVDLNTTAGVVETPDALSTVGTVWASLSLTLQFNISDRLYYYGSVWGRYQDISGSRSDFTTVRTATINSTHNLSLDLPLGLSLGNELTVRKQYGFAAGDLNRVSLRWDADLSRTMWRKRLTLSIAAVDILHNNSSIWNEVNAQGRVENYSNTMPAYVMARLILKFNNRKKSDDD